MPLLEIKNLSFQVGTAKILDDLCLSVEAAEVHALLGINGTGKSTLAYLVVGCEGYRPTAGTILFNGQPRGLIKTRVAIEDEASAEITGITEGNAAGASGCGVSTSISLRNNFSSLQPGGSLCV